MKKTTEFSDARDLLLGLVAPVETVRVPLSGSADRVLGADLIAAKPVQARRRNLL